jgi:hypothetical protein
MVFTKNHVISPVGNEEKNYDSRSTTVERKMKKKINAIIHV